MQRIVLLIFCISLLRERFERFVHAGQLPTVEMNTTYFSWKSGQTVILRCYVTHTDDAIDYVFWIFEHENSFKTITPSTNPDKYRGSTQSYPSLIISNLTYTDEGMYKCAATNEFGTGMSKTVLFLNVTGMPPNVTIPRRYYNGETGRNISLSASIYSPQSALLSVEWLFHFTGGNRQIYVNASTRYMGSSVRNPSLQIVNLTSHDIGNYTCKAFNWYGVGESEQIILEIKEYLPVVNIDQHNYLGDLGGSILIKCSISLPDSEMVSVSWVFYDVRNDSKVGINASTKYEITSNSKLSLLIKNLSFSDEGLYKCLASNSFGTVYSNWTSLLIQDIPVVTIGSELYTAVFGHSATLDCKVSSQTALTRIYWERNSSGNVINITFDLSGIGGASIENPGLTIKVATYLDSAFYTCIAENKYGFGKSNVSRLDVKGGIPVVNGNETAVIANYGVSVTLHVSIASSPEHFNIYWTKLMDSETTIIHNRTIGTSGGSLLNPSLTIEYPTVSDVGIYRCYATNALGIGYSENMSLTIQGDLPIVEVQIEEQTAQFGDTISINCTVRSHPNHTHVYWEKRNGDAVTTLTSETNGIRGSSIYMPSLTIMFATSTDTGSYTCNAENVIGVGISQASKLQINAGAPIVNIGSVFYTTVFGTPVTIDCFIIADPQVRYVFWQKNVNGYLTSITHGAVGTQGISPTIPSLTIMFPSKSDQGEYTCFGVNDLGQRGSIPTLLKVSGGLPVVSIGSSFHSAKFGESFTINCNVLANPLHSLIYWQHNTDGLIRTINKDTLGVSGVSIDDPSLTIDFVTTSDSGLYTCFAENVAGTGNSRHVSLSVDGDIPLVDVILTTITVKHGDDVALLCTVDSIPQHTVVYWIKETEKGDIVLNHGTTGTIGMTVSNPSLSLKPASITDSGLYTCLASNIIGTGTSRPISLKVTSDDHKDQDNSNLLEDPLMLLKILLPSLTAGFTALGAILCKCLGLCKPKLSFSIKSKGTKNKLVVTEGDTVHLKCKSTGFLNITHCTWYVQQENCTDKLKLKKSKGTEKEKCVSCIKCKKVTYDKMIIEEVSIENGFKVIIKNVSKEQQGTYSCKARNRLRRENTCHLDLKIEDKIADPKDINLKVQEESKV